MLVAFVRVERRAPEPILPLGLLRRRLLLTTAFIALGVGVVLMGVTTYVPTYLEVLLGVPPLVSGLALAALTIGWPIAATVSGRIYLRIGFRRTVLIGIGILVTATTALAVTSGTASVAAVALSCFGMGLGLGLVASPSLIAAQSSVDWGERGVVTGANMFARAIGSAVGVAILGALVNGLMDGQDAVSAPERFGDAATAVFTAVAVVAGTLVLAALAMPRHDRPAV